MRTSRPVAGMILMLALAISAKAQQPAPPLQEATITIGEVVVRALPKSYPTGKLHLNDKVKIVQKLEDGWLAIEPPPGSFSWINVKFIAMSAQQKSAEVIADDVPIRVGSSLSNEPPSVERFKLKRGAQVIILDQNKVHNDEGDWLPIVPPPQELRYIPEDAVKTTPQVQTVQSPPVVPVVPQIGNAAPAATDGQDPLWAQAQQAEAAGDLNGALNLYMTLQSKPTTSQELYIACANRIYFIKQRMNGAAAGALRNSNPAMENRVVPPAPTQLQAPRDGFTAPGAKPVNSQYTYYKENAPAAAAVTPTVSSSQRPVTVPAPVVDVPRWSGPGWLRPTPMTTENRRMFAFESDKGGLLMYVSGQDGLDLGPFTNRRVQLFGPVTYRGDLFKQYYMVVQQVQPVQQQN